MDVRTIATVTSKGQVTLPSEIRKAFNVKSGDRLDYYLGEDGKLSAKRIDSNLNSLLGILPKVQVSLSLEEKWTKLSETAEQSRMVGIDTNLLVHFVTRGDEEQWSRVEKYLNANCSEQHPGWISNIVLYEFIWVLDSGYHYRKADIVRLLDQLLVVSSLQFKGKERG